MSTETRSIRNALGEIAEQITKSVWADPITRVQHPFGIIKGSRLKPANVLAVLARCRDIMATAKQTASESGTELVVARHLVGLYEDLLWGGTFLSDNAADCMSRKLHQRFNVGTAKRELLERIKEAYAVVEARVPARLS